MAEFICQTLSRGRQQKLILLLIFGIGVALALESSVYLLIHRNTLHGFDRAAEDTVIAFPLTLSFFAMVGLRRAFRVPIELSANWVFQLTDDASAREKQHEAVFSTLVLLSFIPLLCASPLEFWLLGAKGLLALVLQIALALALGEYLLTGWRSIPFTFAQNPARTHFVLSAVTHLAEFIVYSVIGAGWIGAGMHNLTTLLLFAGVTVATLLLLRSRRLRNCARSRVEFAETPDALVEPLRLISS